jgi:carbon monoxide dehydrogenase subunit G
VPQREASFTVNAPPEDLWRFIRDFESLCTCIPGVERISVVDERTVDLTVREKVGVVPLIVDLRAQIDSEDPPHQLHATAKAEHLTMAIDVTLTASASGTELLTLFDVRGEGQLKAIVDRLFERRATERTAQFADALQQRFGAVASRDASAQISASPVLAGDRGRQLTRWIKRLWLRLLGMFTPPGK